MGAYTAPLVCCLLVPAEVTIVLMLVLMSISQPLRQLRVLLDQQLG